MDPEKIAKMASRYRSAIFTSREWANSLLYDLVSAPELDTAFVSSIDSLPPEVAQEFRHLLARIQEADFHWTPFFLNSSTVPRDPTEYSAQLRRVSALLDQRRANGEVLGPAEPGSQQPVGAGEISGTPADSTRA
jgi:hypothetical protein